MKKVEKYIYIILIIILVAVFASTTTYFAVKNNNTEAKEQNNNFDKKEDQNNKDEEKTEELELNDAKVKEIAKFLELNNYTEFEVGIHEGRKITYNDLVEKEQIVYKYKRKNNNYEAFDSLNESKAEASEYADAIERVNRVVGLYAVHGIAVYEIFKADDFEKDYKSTYGNDKTLERKTFYTTRYTADLYYYDKNDDIYIYGNLYGRGSDGAPRELSKLVKATESNNSIILYDYFMYLAVSDEPNYYSAYKDTKKENVIIGDSELSDKYDSLSKYFEDNYTKGQLYKHIFEVNGDGTYHWVSSEPVDSLN